ncbi:MAG: iron-sulfur cluster assembly scaffold protein [Verrucomicrobiales bacterium]
MNPENQNLPAQGFGEMSDADAVGTAASADCSDMLRMWIKFREEDGKKIIDQATFQSFGCQTAIAVASLATEMIRGRTAEQALALKPEELSAPLGPLPPMKLHCAQLVEGALRAALQPQAQREETCMDKHVAAPESQPTLIDSLNHPRGKPGKIRFLPKS